MKRPNCSNPGGLGFTEMMLCSDSVFNQVCQEIEAGEWNRARTLLKLAENKSDGSSGSRPFGRGEPGK
ncbi:MAG: hypothetical protein HY303_04780 [Candidatus Wallbacteria bacterium]|nr:hypothetical protein [Candidatus Wallbacteria bacterium]